MNIIAGLTDIPSKSGTFARNLDQIFRIAAPKEFTDKDLAALRQASDLFLSKIGQHPDSLSAIMKHLSSGDLAGAQTIAKGLNVADDNGAPRCFLFLIWLIIVIILIECD